jgi:hypothetical protein
MKRMDRDEIYNEKRNHFETDEVYKGFLWWAKPVGWVVNALVVEGASCAAPGGSLGYLVETEISPILPTKFAAYRWLAENVQDYSDVSHYIYRSLL